MADPRDFLAEHTGIILLLRSFRFGFRICGSHAHLCCCMDYTNLYDRNNRVDVHVKRQEDSPSAETIADFEFSTTTGAFANGVSETPAG